MALQIGSLLHERYRIEGQLGKGGMGAVYLAHDTTLDMRVAVKENLNLNPESERQFQREASLLAKLRHPNLPRVIDHFILEERQYLVMDYIEGEDLHARSKRQPPTVHEVSAWANDVCDALAYLHTRQPPIIHRDIKPANLKLQPDGQVILVDFGIAKVFDQGQTTTGARGLTPGYSPPEQYGGGRTDPRSDQYALGATIYSLLTGKAPTDSIERMMKKELLQPARALNPAIAEHVDLALTRALALDQDHRFQDIGDFKAALNGELAAATIFAGGIAQEGVRSPARTKLPTWIWLVGGFIVLALLAGGGLTLAAFSNLIGGRETPTGSATTAVALAPSETPQPSDTSPATAEPSETPLPLSPTPTPSPTQAQAQLGGGGRIAFASNRGEGRWMQIWTMNPDGSDSQQITFGPGDKTRPRWSPDGRRLLFIGPGGQDNFGNELGLDIWVINSDLSSPPFNLSRSPGDETDADWSPDGSQIAFTSTRANNLRQVFVMPVVCDEPPASCDSGGAARNVSFSEDFSAVEYSPIWFPAGDRLAVLASINGAPGRIYFRPPEPNNTPTPYDRSDQIQGAEDLRLSSDGQFLIFTWIQPSSNEIYLAPVDAPARRKRLTNSAGNRYPAISPDGQWIVFASSRDQNFEIYRMQITGANQVNITLSAGSSEQDPDWQPLPP